MKKWLPVIGTGALAVSLAACGAQTENGLTVEEVFAKSAEASEEVNSMHAEMAIEQTITSEEMDMSTSMDMAVDMVVEPLAMHQEGTVIIKAPEMPEMPMEMEMYMTPEGIYMHDGMSGGWIKMPGDDVEQMQAMMNQQAADPAEQLEQLEPFQDDFTFEETEEAYVLSLDASGEEFQQLLDQEMENLADQLGAEGAETLGEVEIKSVQYKIDINKETYMTESLDMTMDLSMTAEGETVDVIQKVESVFSQFDEIEAISVPQDIIDQAQEF
ncbi:DUF6612 family protein [Planococcus lenghuensis]|uniref:Lipoprotein n=1 Tax=Planococcus lenghuensis TaxID=2213202 RepID=A0A1Q2KV42_9BACL|nr:DUF6612 family protein [Planococcus lenghuensis]AQQ52061.1 hypothetical protein B0X71_02275 [Planococcus lenghuensis]